MQHSADGLVVSSCSEIYAIAVFVFQVDLKREVISDNKPHCNEAKSAIGTAVLIRSTNASRFPMTGGCQPF